ncbi:sugar transferase [Fusicatenibacter sp.]
MREWECGVYQKYLKNLLDWLIALLGTVLLSWLLLLLGIAVRLDSAGPVFFRQRRVGKNGVYFYIYKFRTMRIDTPHDMPTHLLHNPEIFITRTGRFLRKTSLDELPQLFNLLKGDMALVGPRPALWNQKDLFLERERYGANDVRPGLTGWAQIHGRDELPIREKAELDGYYVQHMHLGMDLACLWKTAGTVLRQEGIHEGTMEKQMVKAKQ